jgi:hypothetical protein
MDLPIGVAQVLRVHAWADGGMPDATDLDMQVPLPGRRIVIALASFSALSAVAGGAALVIWARSNTFLPLAVLRHTPFDSFLVPGLVLAGVVGGSNVACALLAWRRARGAVDATLVAGAALLVWIVAETAMLREVRWLMLLYGSLGAALLAIGARAGWRGRSARHRWTIAVTAAETVGFLFPACAAVFATQAGLTGAPLAAVVVAAGLLEGLSLGAGQAMAFPFPVRRLRYALLTAIAAGVVWLCMLAVSASFRGGGAALFRGGALIALAIVAGLIVACGALGAIGAAQWIELRHHLRRSRRWIGWTALAWALALPFSFAPGPFVDESTPIAAHLALWGCGAMLMAYVMAQVTWQGVRRLAPVDLLLDLPLLPAESRDPAAHAIARRQKAEGVAVIL